MLNVGTSFYNTVLSRAPGPHGPQDRMLECFECGLCGNARVGTELRLQTGRPARRVWVTCVALRAGAVSVAVAVAQNDGRLQMLRDSAAATRRTAWSTSWAVVCVCGRNSDSGRTVSPRSLSAAPCCTAASLSIAPPERQ